MSKKFLAVVMIVFVGAFAMGAAIGAEIHESIFRTSERQRVTEVYRVKRGDTLWDVVCRYQAKDCRNIYVPEFKTELEKQNPFLIDRGGVIYPGDEIIVEYVELKQ